MKDNPVDKAMQTMVKNLQDKTGKSLEDWIAIVHELPCQKTGEIVKYLKEHYDISAGYSGLIIESGKLAAGIRLSGDAQVDAQYKGKEHWKPVYDKLLSIIRDFGEDVLISPKNSYVSLRRKTQFAQLTPATKTRFEIGLKLKGQEPQGILSLAKGNVMCTHLINLSSVDDITPEVVEWLRKAYTKAK